MRSQASPTIQATATTHFRFEGFAASVAYRAAELTKKLSAFGTAAEAQTDWTAIRDVHAFAKQQGDVWRISVKPSDAAALAAKLGATAVQYDWGGGLIWALSTRQATTCALPWAALQATRH